MELYVLYDEVASYFAQQNITIYHSFVGDYVTSLEMNGAALTILRVEEDFKELLDMEIATPALKI